MSVLPMAMSSDCAVDVDAVGVSIAALAQRWTDAVAFRANFLCQTSNMTLRRIGARLACRIGAAVCQKRREWGPLQVEIWGLSPISNSVNLSHLVFCENIACEPHYCSCVRALDFVISGPIVAFSANSGSIICNEAPLWHFLPISSVDLYCRVLSLRLPIGFQSSASAKDSGQALARGVSAKACCKGFHGVFRMVFCDG